MALVKRHMVQVDMETGDVQEGMALFVPQKAKLKDIFMLIMLEAAKKIAEDKEIKWEDHRVFWALIGFIDYENYIRVSQVDIAEKLGMRTSHVSRSIKRLVDKKLLLEVGKEGRSKVYRLNAFYGWRGRINKEYQDAFEEHSKLIS